VPWGYFLTARAEALWLVISANFRMRELLLDIKADLTRLLFQLSIFEDYSDNSGRVGLICLGISLLVCVPFGTMYEPRIHTQENVLK
jgi:hypothetical protein